MDSNIFLDEMNYNPNIENVEAYNPEDTTNNFYNVGDVVETQGEKNGEKGDILMFIVLL